jgi:hypothetical protein
MIEACRDFPIRRKRRCKRAHEDRLWCPLSTPAVSQHPSISGEKRRMKEVRL